MEKNLIANNRWWWWWLKIQCHFDEKKNKRKKQGRYKYGWISSLVGLACICWFSFVRVDFFYFYIFLMKINNNDFLFGYLFDNNFHWSSSSSCVHHRHIGCHFWWSEIKIYGESRTKIIPCMRVKFFFSSSSSTTTNLMINDRWSLIIDDDDDGKKFIRMMMMMNDRLQQI